MEQDIFPAKNSNRHSFYTGNGVIIPGNVEICNLPCSFFKFFFMTGGVMKNLSWECCQFFLTYLKVNSNDYSYEVAKVS